MSIAYSVLEIFAILEICGKMDSEARMADSLANRLNQRHAAQQHAQQTEQDKINFQQWVNAFISDNARPEYDRMMANLKQKVEEVNAGLHDLPHF